MTRCIKCHDEDGNSSGSGMPNLTGQDPDYFVTTMKAYGDGSRRHKLKKKLVGKMDDATIEKMGVYYAVQPPVRTETLGEGDVAEGRRLVEDCDKCHGDEGNADQADMPTLAGQDARYFIKAMEAYSSGARDHEKMYEAVGGTDRFADRGHGKLLRKPGAAKTECAHSPDLRAVGRAMCAMPRN